MAHPLIRHATIMWPADGDLDVKRESISGLTDPPFWKVKTGRWRGAVWVDPDTGQAWLVAGGLRRKGDVTDFYADFMVQVEARGASAFLPTEEDRDRLEREGAIAAEAAWATDVSLSVVRTVAEASRNGSARTNLPSLFWDRRDPLELRLEVEREPGEWDPERAHETASGVSIQLRVLDWSDPEVLERVQVLACWTISPSEDDWDVAPSEGGPILMTTVSEARLRQIVVAEQVSDLGAETGPPGEMSPTTHAHYAPSRLLARATVEGLAVPALCGTWFVPRQDHVDMPVCGACEARHVRDSGGD